MSDKKGVIYLLKYLQDNTDMDHPATSSELKTVLRENGYACDPRTIRKDADLLIDAGFDVLVEEQNGVPTQYSYGSRDWDTTELMILIDAVSSAPFLTAEKSRKMIEKLAQLASPQERESLKPEIIVSEHIKAENDQILYTIGRISEGIRKKKKISFRIRNYSMNKRKTFRNGGEVYVISPYHTVWNSDRYYVTGYSDKRQKVITVRIDKMEVPTVTDEDAVPPPRDYNVQNYVDTITRMYDGTEEDVTLRCTPDLVDHIIDKFGKQVKISNVKEDSFDATAHVSVSSTFLSWVFQYRGQIRIIGPESVQQQYLNMLENATHVQRNL